MSLRRVWNSSVCDSADSVLKLAATNTTPEAENVESLNRLESQVHLVARDRRLRINFVSKRLQICLQSRNLF